MPSSAATAAYGAASGPAEHGLSRSKSAARPVAAYSARAVEDPVEQGQGPGAVEEPLGRQVVGRLVEVAALGVAGVDREDRPAAAALQGPVAVAAVGQEEGAVGQQERAEAALGRVGGGERALLQQPGEVVLGQVGAASGSWPLRRMKA